MLTSEVTIPAAIDINTCRLDLNGEEVEVLTNWLIVVVIVAEGTCGAFK